MPRDNSIKKVLVIGSGPIVIGQAAEFDYAGTQACRVLRDAGVKVVLVNSNPATIMTDQALADAIYLEPLTVTTVKRIIEKEKPDGLLATLGGQTGLTLAMKLSRDGYLERHGVRLLGTRAEAIDKAEDRELFRETMQAIGQPIIPSAIAVTVEEALAVAETLGYPVIVRPAFTLGGAGGGVAYDTEELRRVAKTGLDLSPITQVLVERYIYGWKEIEFEVMRDGAGNAVAVCSMENFDPVGVHTGDSIVIAPAVTLADREYQMLRSAAIDIIQALGIEGGCNCQFALNPNSFEYAVIEVNPRVSRSSALASKATGYPIAKVTAKIALGYRLDEIKNDVTGRTTACFEPALDYVVVKLPKWPFDKFVSADRHLGTQMKATGEIMAIAPTFEMALLKAVRGAEISFDTLRSPRMEKEGDIEAVLARCDDQRVFAVFEALRRGITKERIFEITRIDLWFLSKIENLLRYEEKIRGKTLSSEEYLRGKKLGYPDAALARLSGAPLPAHRAAVYKMVDTCAAEFAAQTPYFYSSYDDVCEARQLRKAQAGGRERIVVLGSGPIRIGQGIEFDYSSVHCVWSLKKLGYEVVILNNNPETVSTDFDTADRLYFEPLTPEDLDNVLAVENPVGVVVAFGGQTAIRLTKHLAEKGVHILGTSAEGIDIAEDRGRFDAVLEKFGIKRPRAMAVMTLPEALEAADKLCFPVLLRPSYVIGGQNMTIAYTPDDVTRYMEMILEHDGALPVLIDQYLMGKELEVDVLSDGTDVLIPGIMEHIERAGIHSGDSIAIYPPQTIGDAMLETIVDSSTKLALSLGTKGLVNIQYLIYGGELYVIEVNPRASRTVPYVSKVTGVPMVDLAANIMVGKKLRSLGYGTGLYRQPPYVAVKVPVFSFEKLSDVNAALGPEMKSTGEVLGIGKNLQEALFKGLLSAGFTLHTAAGGRRNSVLITVNKSDRFELVRLAKKLSDLGLRIYATEGTASAITPLDIDVTVVGKLYESDDMLRLLDEERLNYIVYTGKSDKASIADYIKLHRGALRHSVACLTSLDTANALADIIASRYREENTELVDLCRMRIDRQRLRFTKMEGTGDDYIFFENFDNEITCPESLSISFCDRSYGIGGTGIVLIEHSDVADAKMRNFNRDGSEGQIAGNCLRCVGKYLYDRGIARKERLTIETASGVKKLRLYSFGGSVGAVEVDIGRPVFEPAKIPVRMAGEEVVGRELTVDGKKYFVTCLSVGNPHCVVFVDRVDDVDIERVGPLFENHPAFPTRINTEFVRVVNRKTIKMRTWERGNGETAACGTGACAAAVAALRNGFCDGEGDITVKLRGGDLTVRIADGHIYLTGNACLVYEGVVEY